MTFDSNLPESGEEPEAVDQPTESEEVASGPLTSAEAMFSSGEGMVAFGGILVLIVYLIFDVITDDYGIATLAVVMAIVATVLPRMDRDSIEKIAPLPVLMKTTGYLLAITGLTEIITDVEGALFDEFLTVIAALGAYAGYALALLGANSIET